MTYCPQCGTPFDFDDCPTCGFNLDTGPEDDDLFQDYYDDLFQDELTFNRYYLSPHSAK